MLLVIKAKVLPIMDEGYNSLKPWRARLPLCSLNAETVG